MQALLAAAAELLLLALSPAQQPQHQAALQQLAQAWQAASGAANLDATAAAAGAHVSAGPTAEAQHAQQLAAVHALQQVLAQLQQMLAALPAQDGDAAQRVQQDSSAAAARAAELAATLAGGAESAAGKFEWVDGALTR